MPSSSASTDKADMDKKEQLLPLADSDCCSSSTGCCGSATHNDGGDQASENLGGTHEDMSTEELLAELPLRARLGIFYADDVDDDILECTPEFAVKAVRWAPALPACATLALSALTLAKKTPLPLTFSFRGKVKRSLSPKWSAVFCASSAAAITLWGLSRPEEELSSISVEESMEEGNDAGVKEHIHDELSCCAHTEENFSSAKGAGIRALINRNAMLSAFNTSLAASQLIAFRQKEGKVGIPFLIASSLGSLAVEPLVDVLATRSALKNIRL